MTCSGERRVRLGEVIEMAQRYRGWSRRELARSIGRDPTKLIPSTGLPRLDFLVELAGALDWEVDDLVSHLWGGNEIKSSQFLMKSCPEMQTSMHLISLPKNAT